MSDRTHDSSATIVRRLAEWVNAFAPTEMTAATAERARAILLDSIACALYASEDATALAAMILAVVAAILFRFILNRKTSGK